MADEELQNTLRKVLAPMVRADEGDLYLVSASSHEVRLHLRGRFAGCPGNSLVSEEVIKPLIRAVHPQARVDVSSGAILPEGATLVEPLH